MRTSHGPIGAIPSQVSPPRRGHYRRVRSSEVEQATPLLRMLAKHGLDDPSLLAHCEAVGDLAARVGHRLGLAEPVVTRLHLAGLLHDIGKLTLPDSILRKPGPLTEGEWSQIRRHPETGWHLIRSVGLEEIGEWVLCHHERPDGRGYPFGFTSQRIPLGGAILAAADAYQAMTVDRPYQVTLTETDARQELHRCAGTQFEPAVVAALLASRQAQLAR